MNQKAFVLVGIFLAVALIFPPYILITQSDADLYNLVNQGPNLADETQTQEILENMDARNT
jgi:hypothetical protein